MKREFLEELLPADMEGRKEIVDKIMAENGEDVEKAKAKQVKDIEQERDNLKGKLDEANSKNEELKGQIKDKDETIKGLEESVGNEEEMKAQLEAYKEKEKKAEEERKQEQIEEGLKARFENVTDGAEFVNEFTKEGAYNNFKEALDNPENKGKGDKEIYQALMKGNEGWLKQPQNFPDMSGMGSPDVDMTAVEKYKAMSLQDRMKWANENPEQFAEIKKAL